jgi:hypothetical protein
MMFLLLPLFLFISSPYFGPFFFLLFFPPGSLRTAFSPFHRPFYCVFERLFISHIKTAVGDDDHQSDGKSPGKILGPNNGNRRRSHGKKWGEAYPPFSTIFEATSTAWRCFPLQVFFLSDNPTTSEGIGSKEAII